jgi:hypothetical protein
MTMDVGLLILMFDLSHTNVRTFLISKIIGLLIVMFDLSHTNVRTFLISNIIGVLIVMFTLQLINKPMLLEIKKVSTFV